MRWYGLSDSSNTVADQQRLDSDISWTALRADIESGLVDFVLARPPSSTFSAGRHHASGPPPLRSQEHPYGLPRSLLSPRQREEVRMGSYHALQTLSLLQAAVKRGVGFALFVPRPLPGLPTILNLPEGHNLLHLSGVYQASPDLCMYGARDQHPVTVVYFRVKLSGLERVCNHPSTAKQWKDLNGRSQAAVLPHFPVFHRLLADGTSAAMREVPMPLATSLAVVRAAVDQGRAPPLPRTAS